MNKELAAELLALAERLHDLALRIEAEANPSYDGDDYHSEPVTGTGVEQVLGLWPECDTTPGIQRAIRDTIDSHFSVRPV